MNENRLYRGKKCSKDEWIAGIYVCEKEIHFIIECNLGKERSLEARSYRVAPETISRFTGVNDKNGDRIWENDICVDCDHNIFEVQYNSDRDEFLCRYKITDKDEKKDKEFSLKEVRSEDITVIGNAFDNVEAAEEYYAKAAGVTGDEAMIIIKKDKNIIRLEGTFEIRVIDSFKKKGLKRIRIYDLAVFIGGSKRLPIPYLTIGRYESRNEAKEIRDDILENLIAGASVYRV